MERLHSKFTFFRKYFFSIFLLIVPIVTAVFFIKIKLMIGAVIALMVLVILFGIVKNYYWGIKCVYLDEENNRLLVKENNKNIFIEFAEIEKVELVQILRTVAVITLKKEIKNMSDFTFLPKSYFLFKSSTVKKLNDIIKLNTPGNNGLNAT